MWGEQAKTFKMNNRFKEFYCNEKISPYFLNNQFERLYESSGFV